MATTVWLLTAFFAQWVVIVYPGVLVFWVIVHNTIQRLRPIGPRAYWLVAGLSWAVTAGPLLYFRRAVFAKPLPAPDVMVKTLIGLGAIAFLVAAWFFLQAAQQIPISTMIGLPEIEPHKNKQPILNKGIYSRTRNPIYFAHWLLVFSAAALTNFAANWILFALDCLILPLLILSEERELLSRYGSDFAAYMRRVPRFFPQSASGPPAGK